MRRAIFIIITLLCIGVKVHAQIDPTLAGMVLIYTEKSKKTLKNQEKSCSCKPPDTSGRKRRWKPSPTCNGSSMIIWIHSVRSSVTPHRYTASITR